MSILLGCGIRCSRSINVLFKSSQAFRPFGSSSRSFSTGTSSPSTSPPTIFSGIQPTGVPHLGNYLGALRPWKSLQDEALKDTRILFAIVDLHALTTPENAGFLSQWTKEIVAALLAVGLDPRKCTIFCQSDVPAHSELMWILSTVASTGKLSKMTQWKSKLDLPSGSDIENEAARARLKLGLYSYPVLQAADILLHRATSVPVGEDQSQHLEFARDLANTFNFTFKQPVFAEPNGLICQALYPFPLFLANASLALAPAKRIMSLKDPTQKMSKSSPNTASRILINDDADVIRDKIAKSLTDSHTQSITYDPLSRPGIANLIDILRHTTKTQTPPEDIAAHFNNVQGVKVKALKGAVADAVVRELAPVRERYDALIAKDAQGHSHALSEPLLIGREKAKKSAMKTMKLVRQAVDLPCYN